MVSCRQIQPNKGKYTKQQEQQQQTTQNSKTKNKVKKVNENKLKYLG